LIIYTLLPFIIAAETEAIGTRDSTVYSR